MLLCFPFNKYKYPQLLMCCQPGGTKKPVRNRFVLLTFVWKLPRNWPHHGMGKLFRTAAYTTGINVIKSPQ